jgi:hypothetical protein
LYFFPSVPVILMVPGLVFSISRTPITANIVSP